MSMQGDIARETDTHYIAEVISKEIDKNHGNRDVVAALKEVGRKVLDILPNVPNWALPYVKKFQL